MAMLDKKSTVEGINLKTADPRESIEALKSEASKQLKKILAQNKSIKDFKSNIDNLLARYHADESLFGKVALWYGSLSWWVKLSHIAVIGAICWASIIIGLVVFVAYSALALVLIDYYNVSEKRDKRLCADIIALEKSLAESVDHISSIEDSLTKVFTSLCEMDIEKSNDIALFKAQINQLETQLQLLTDITNKVSNTNDSLAESTAKITQSFEKAKSNFNDVNHFISTELEGMKQTEERLSNSNDLLVGDHNLLNSVNVQFQENTCHLTRLAGNLSNIIGQLKTHVEIYESSQDILLKTTSLEINTVVKTKDILAHADDTVAEALKVMEDYEHDSLDTTDSFSDTDENFSSEVVYLLARAKNAISSQVKPIPQGICAYSVLLQ